MTVDLARIRNLAEAMRERVQASQARTQRDPLKRSWYRIEDKAGDASAPAEVYLYDMIGEWGVSAQDFVNDLRGITAKTINLRVSCEGGEVFDGLAIYESLVRHPAAVTAFVDGIAASAASFIVQAANKIVMAPRARMMIHDAHGFSMGNARDMRAMADLLDALSDNIADIYADHAGGTRAQWRETMRAASGGPDGTWYDAAGAVRAGLADEVRGDDGKALAVRGDDGTALAVVDRAPAPAPIEFTPEALIGTLREIEDRPEPVQIPDADALRTLFQ
jgi:ATP-dependent protease ClpP protease subunit